ncbi:peptidase [Mycobacteroides abscessus subsp. abscessus]|uniref:M24 family metallopeptidase n=1 Tax=Mycobacteroides abscessus TaxID=36809 RepID=UPI0009281032|nr:M24 family metallopeptidase [Mycobacteroides abscessus]SHT74261.1 peptidase [Mycobacteroides abscessus subsp. abscessus]
MESVPALSLAERDRRWGLARELMRRTGVDALIVYGDREAGAPAAFNVDGYFTNDRLGSIVLFVRDEAPTVLTFASMMIADHLQARYRGDTQWIEPDQIFVGKTGSHLAAALKHRGVSSGPVGVLGLEPYPPFYFDGAIPFRTLHAVTEALPDISLVPVYRQFFELASVRSEEELRLVRHAAGIGERMCDAMRAEARPGATEADLVAAAVSTCLRDGGYTAEVLIGSGPEHIGWGPAAWNYRAQPPRVLAEGDVVLAEVFSLFGLFETQHQPMIAIGEPHPEFLRAAAVARASYEAGVGALRAGNTFGDVVDAMEAPLLEAQGWHVHPLIHSINPYGPIGFGTAPGIEVFADAAGYGDCGRPPTVGREVELKESMSFAFEPNCGFGRRLANLGGTVLVGTDRGLELNGNSTRLMWADGVG